MDLVARLDLVTGRAIERGRRFRPVGLTRHDDGTAVRLTAGMPGSEAMQVRVPLAAGEHIAGFGEQYIHVDKRGRMIDGWIGTDGGQAASPYTKGVDGGYCLSPLWYSSGGYAAYAPTTRRWRADVGVLEPAALVLEVPGDEIELVVIPGAPADAIAELTARIGRASLPPRWVFGPWKSIRGGHAMTTEYARWMRDEGLPVTAIWIDAHYQPATNTGFPAAGGWPLGDYPDIAATVAELHGAGLRALTYLNPFLYVDTPANDHAIAHGYAVSGDDGNPSLISGLHPFEGDVRGLHAKSGIHSRDPSAALIDFTNPDATAWFQGLVRDVLLREGFDGFMQDFGEEVGADARFADGTTGDAGHNRYPVLYHSATAEVVAAVKPDAAFFTRSGHLGSQAFATILWAGDQDRDWSRDAGIGAVAAGGISAGLSGFSTWGPDIGGTMDFSALGAPRGGGSDDVELWIRWCQLGAMSPIMRDHQGFLDEGAIDIFNSAAAADTWRITARWHTSLAPYLWSAAAEARRTGMPILRGLMLTAPDHDEAWTVNDEWLLGPALLCAPVIEPDARCRRVWLPPGTWRDVWAGVDHAGPGWVEIPAPLDRWPVLQRIGQIVVRLADPPASLAELAAGPGTGADTGLDLVAELVPGDSPAAYELFDGTRVEVADGTLTHDGPHSFVLRAPDYPVSEAGRR